MITIRRPERAVGLNRILELVATEPEADAPPLPPQPPTPPIAPEKMSLRAEYKRAWKLITRHNGGRKPFVWAFLMLVFEAVTAVAEPFPIAYTIDFIQGAAPSLRERGIPAFMTSERVETIFLLGIAIIAIVAINKAADSMAEIFLARGGRAIGFNIRVTMYSRLQKLSMAFHDKRRTGDVITRVTGDVLVVEEFVVASLSNIVASFLLLFGSFAVLITQSLNVALLAAVFVPLLALVSNFFSRRLKTMTKRQRSREGDLASTAQEMLSSIRLVQSYGRGNVDLDRFSGQSDQSMHAALKVATIQAQFSFVIALLEGLTITSIVWLGVWLVDSDAISIGTLVLLVLLIQNMFKPARKIVSEWYKVGKLLASVERINELLDREPAVQDTPESREAPEFIGRLTFEDVDFSYHSETEHGLAAGERPVLHHINFTAAPGEVVALVGVSGAGKSSIAQLVPRLYDPDGGAVLIDGFDVRQFTLASLRRQVSLVLQETLLLSGTVAENIAYGIDDATTDQVIQAARQANAHDFIEELPDGYDTVLGERGSTLSGGQRQRIAIARAFIRWAPVLVLDEPTTGLDPDSTSIVVDALKTLMHGTTTVVISHEMRLIQSADRILVLENGRIVQEGAHEDLARAKGPYADLLAHQVDLTVDGEPVKRKRTAPPQTGAHVKTTNSHAPSKWSLRAHLPTSLRGVPHAARVRHTAESWVADNLPGRTVANAVAGKYLYGADSGLSLRFAVELESPSPAPDVRTLLVRAAADGTTLSVNAFPHDPDLPTLGTMLDRSAVLSVLRHSLSGIGRDRGLAGCSVGVVHHPRVGAAVLRYDLMPGAAGFNELQYPQVFAKVYPQAAEAAAAAAALRAAGTTLPPAGNGLQVRLPRLLGESREMATNFIESLNSPSGSAARSAASMPITVREAATVLQVLHRHEPSQEVPTFTLADELRKFDSELAIVSSAWPTIAARIDELVASARRSLEQGPEGSFVLSHGDFTPAQLLRREDGIALIDLDSLCRAEVAFDAGRYLAYADQATTRSGTGKHGSLSAREFLVAYSHDGMGRKEQFMDRVRGYRSISLARMALRAARQLKDARLDRALSLLETDESNHGGNR